MRKAVYLFSLIMVLSGCTFEGQEKKSIPASDTKDFTSQRHLHEAEYGALNLENEQAWDSLNHTSKNTVKHVAGKVHPNVRTFGWHTYSKGSAWKNYNFDMLWGISYFSYAIEPETGSYKNLHQWKTSAMIDSASAHNCKVFLSVSNFGNSNNATFLENEKTQETLIDSLVSLLAYRNADGINIDFEGVAKKNKSQLTAFIAKASTRLKKENPKYMVSLCLYAEDWNSIFNIKSIDEHIDFYTLMAYDYYGSFSKTTGPVAPLQTSPKFGNGIEHSVAAYHQSGIAFEKLIVGLPYYGAEWYTSEKEIGAEAISFKSHPPYHTIKELYIDSLNIPLEFDPKSSTSYLVIEDSSGHYRQLFFEDRKSLAAKYDWIKEKKLGGVGIWALGYDDGYSELWNLLTEKFSVENY